MSGFVENVKMIKGLSNHYKFLKFENGNYVYCIKKNKKDENFEENFLFGKLNLPKNYKYPIEQQY